MVQTINLINVTGHKKKVLATANLEIDTMEDEKTIRNTYQKVLPRALEATKKQTNSSAADFLEKATQMVMDEHPDMILLNVNDDRKKGNQKTAINFNFTII